MRVLAVDTTGAHGSVALLEGDELRSLVGVATGRPQHAETLLPTIDEILRRLSLGLEEIEGYAVAVGPGSFTGLRIGIAAVEGLAFATGRPAVGVSTLEATAFRFRFLDGLVVSFLEAYRGEIYGATYRAERGKLSSVSDPTCQPPERFLDSLPGPPRLVAGTGLLRHREAVTSRFEGVLLADPSFFLAEEIGRLGKAKLETGEGARRGSLRALYVRPPEAERTRDSQARPE